MKLNILTTTALLALAGTALTQSAKAQFTSNFAGTANVGDLILSFADNTTSDNGNTTNYEVDLGNFSQYQTATSTIPIVNIASDLNSIYSSSNPLTNPNIAFSLLGYTDVSTTNNSLLIGIANPSAPNGAQADSVVGNAEGAVEPIYSPGTAPSNLPTDGTAKGSFIVPTVNGSSYNTAAPNVGFPTAISLTAAGAPDIYLEQITHANSTKNTVVGGDNVDTTGYFTVTSGGEVEYVVASAAPEPSTYALMALGAGFLVWQLRRKSVSSL